MFGGKLTKKLKLLWLSFTGLVFILIVFWSLFCNVSKIKDVPTPLPSPTIIKQLITKNPEHPKVTPTPTITPEPITNTQQPITPPTPSVPQFYTVLPGETLWEIAGKLGMNMEDLAVANHLADANLIYAGQELYLGAVPVVVPEPTIQNGKQIIVILSTQRAYTFEDGVLAHSEFIVATGTSAYPTVTGNYKIYIKLESARMTGPGYDIPNVPWTMYFFKGYGLHGAPWNHNLGHPGSHGCINMSVEDANWLFNWAPIDTPVLILP